MIARKYFIAYSALVMIEIFVGMLMFLSLKHNIHICTMARNIIYNTGNHCAVWVDLATLNSE